MDEAGSSGNGIPTTPIPYQRGEDDASTGSLEGYEDIDLGGLFESQSFELKSDGDSAAQSPPANKETGKVTIARRRLTKPLSAYNLYFKSIKGQVEEEMRGKGKVGFDQLGKIIGARWKRLSKEERSVYEHQADEDVIRYRTQMMEQEKLEQRKREAGRQGEERKRKLRSRQVGVAESHADYARAQTQQRRPPIIVRVRHIPPPPPIGRYLGPAPPYLGLDQGETVRLRDQRGQTRTYEVRYECYSIKRADLDAYLAQLPENTRHFVDPLRF